VGQTEFPERRIELPLEQCEALQSTDPDEIKERMAERLCPHELEIIERGARLDARFHFAQFGSMGLMFVRYGAAVRVRPDVTGFVAVQLHLTGNGKVTCGAQQIWAHRERAMVANYDEPLEMWLSADTMLLLVRLEHQTLVEQAAQRVGEALPLRFELGMDCAGGYPRMWVELLTSLVRRRGRLEMISANLLAAPPVEEFLVANLLTASRNNYNPLLAAAPGRLASSKLVCEATQLIDADPREPRTVSEIARRVGTDLFTLDGAFQHCRGTTVQDYLRQARLKGAFRELRQTDPAATTVEQVAWGWGFVETSEFTARYSAEFGETPHVTLSRGT